MARGPIPDKPPNRPRANDVARRIAVYKQQPGNAVGGSLHIVTDDYNLNDHHLRFCVTHARKCHDPIGQAIAEDLLAMSRTQRRKAVCTAWTYARALTARS